MALAVAAMLLAAPVDAGADREVGAEGNVFTGGLRFNPESVSVVVGERVRWVNRDEVVPHTATEDHGLWDLTGTYGQTPANPPGFGPGESRERAFEAGTHRYYCRVHPEEMRGTVTVPAKLGRRVTRAGRPALRNVKAVWAPGAPADGLVFDVQRRLPGRDWRSLAQGTRAASARFRWPRGMAVEVRARLRRGDDATNWSPPVSIRAR